MWTPTDTNKHISFKPVDVDGARKALVDRDRQYSDDQIKNGLAKTFLVYASPEVRLYRAGNLPYIGSQTAADVLAQTKGQITWQPINGDVSRAGDLGYTHGTYEHTDDAKNVIERGSYDRIWQKQGGTWRIVMDVTNVHPK